MGYSISMHKWPCHSYIFKCSFNLRVNQKTLYSSKYNKDIFILDSEHNLGNSKRNIFWLFIPECNFRIRTSTYLRPVSFCEVLQWELGLTMFQYKHFCLVVTDCYASQINSLKRNREEKSKFEMKFEQFLS